jgi:hypothetical protein
MQIYVLPACRASLGLASRVRTGYSAVRIDASGSLKSHRPDLLPMNSVTATSHRPKTRPFCPDLQALPVTPSRLVSIALIRSG